MSEAQPYFQGQHKSYCCYYPDVARTPTGAIHCCHHGWVEGQGKDTDIPTEQWRESERVRLRELDKEIKAR